MWHVQYYTPVPLAALNLVVLWHRFGCQQPLVLASSQGAAHLHWTARPANVATSFYYTRLIEERSSCGFPCWAGTAPCDSTLQSSLSISCLFWWWPFSCDHCFFFLLTLYQICLCSVPKAGADVALRHTAHTHVVAPNGLVYSQHMKVVPLWALTASKVDFLLPLKREGRKVGCLAAQNGQVPGGGEAGFSSERLDKRISLCRSCPLSGLVSVWLNTSPLLVQMLLEAPRRPSLYPLFIGLSCH